jgi:hypothetical protein
LDQPYAQRKSQSSNQDAQGLRLPRPGGDFFNHRQFGFNAG